MCHYITGTLSKGSDVKAIATIFLRYGVGCEEIDNPHLRSQLPPGTIYISTTRMHCDCGTELGSRGEKRKHGSSSEMRDLEKLRDKGWSEAKIERWRKNKEVARSNSYAKSGAVRVSDWMQCLRAALESGKTSRVGLLLHWYTDKLETEGMVFKTAIPTQIDQVTSDFLLTIEEDTLYTFTL